MANEARSHLFIKSIENSGTTHQKVPVNTLPADVPKSQRWQTNDGRNVEAVRPELNERQCSPRQSPSHICKKSQSEKVRHRNGIYHHPNTVKADKQEVKQVSNEELSTVASAQRLSRDDHLSKSSKSTDKHRSQAVSQNDSDIKKEKRKKEKNRGTTSDVQQQLLLVKPTAENSETKLKNSSSSRHKKKVASHSNKEYHPSDNDRRLKSVIVKPADESQNGSGGRNLSVHDISCKKSSRTMSDNEIKRIVLHSFDEVREISVLCIVDIHHIAIDITPWLVCWLFSG